MDDSAFDVDFFVIGGGSGGVRAARIPARGKERLTVVGKPGYMLPEGNVDPYATKSGGRND